MSDLTYTELMEIYVESTKRGEMQWLPFEEKSQRFHTQCYRSDLADPNKEVILKRHAKNENHYLVSHRFKDGKKPPLETAVYEELDMITGERMTTIDSVSRLWRLIQKSLDNT